MEMDPELSVGADLIRVETCVVGRVGTMMADEVESVEPLASSSTVKDATFGPLALLSLCGMGGRSQMLGASVVLSTDGEDGGSSTTALRDVASAICL